MKEHKAREIFIAMKSPKRVAGCLLDSEWYDHRKNTVGAIGWFYLLKSYIESPTVLQIEVDSTLYEYPIPFPTEDYLFAESMTQAFENYFRDPKSKFKPA